MKMIDEKELLNKLRNGDHLAFEYLYNEYKEPIARKLFGVLKSWDDTQEILQELFVRIWQHRTAIQSERSFSAYLYRIAANLTADHFKKISRDRKLAEALWLTLSQEHDTEILCLQTLADQQLMQTIEKLPRQRRTVFKLCKLEGKSYREVSAMLKISEAAVNDHITKANKFLLKNYDKSASLFFALLISNTIN
ncbi:RNA polymerase sigma factor [Chryseobacterium sp. c4a]|uniref:RNA polymerase sigma factor n=1 Tax=Chryseobacterium sp. c4a TaxID=1573582 RepID=UPI00135A0B66|nr:sigma-70 family RNA polymerase sigma factor [Chryseobacterium sp. c4a]